MADIKDKKHGKTLFYIDGNDIRDKKIWQFKILYRLRVNSRSALRFDFNNLNLMFFPKNSCPIMLNDVVVDF